MGGECCERLKRDLARHFSVLMVSSQFNKKVLTIKDSNSNVVASAICYCPKGLVCFTHVCHPSNLVVTRFDNSYFVFCPLFNCTFTHGTNFQIVPYLS